MLLMSTRPCVTFGTYMALTSTRRPRLRPPWGWGYARGYPQRWDVRSAQGENHSIANSDNVAAKIKKPYGRRTAVIHPAVAMERFYLLAEPQLSAMVAYKNVGIAIEAFSRLKLPLRIAYEGRSAEMGIRVNVEPNIEVDEAGPAEFYAGATL